MDELNELFKAYNHGSGGWHNYLKSIRVTNIHGWNGQEMEWSRDGI